MSDNVKIHILWGAFVGCVVVSFALFVLAVLYPYPPTPYEKLVRHIASCEQCNREPGTEGAGLCPVGLAMLNAIQEGE